MKKSLVLSVLVPAALFACAATPRPAEVSVSVDTDKTALWVGEVLRYTVRTLHPPEVEFVTDNLTPEQLRLAPFKVRAVEIERGSAGPERRRLQVTLLLSSVETGKPELTVPPLHLYYFRRAPGVSRQDSAVEVLRAPPVTVGLRSALTAQAWRLRDAKPLVSASWQGWTALVLGLAGFGVLGGTAGYRAWRRWRHPEPSAAARRAQRARLAQALLNEVRQTDTAEPQVFCAAVARALRAYIKEAFELDAAGLTPAEIEAGLSTAPAAFRQQVRHLLDECDRLRYGKPGARPDGVVDRLRAGTEALLQAPA